MASQLGGSRVGRWLLLALCIGALLIPIAGLSALAVMVLSVPVALTGVRQRDQTFRWWAIYVLAFSAFARLRDLADLLLPPQLRRHGTRVPGGCDSRVGEWA